MDVKLLREVFTLDHPGFTSRVVVVDLGPHHYWITGEIISNDGVHAGKFIRNALRRGDEWIAIHNELFVEEVFRERKIARRHYQKLFKNYLRLRCFRVEMYAYEFGTFVWPQLGFQFVWDEDRQDVIRELEAIHGRETGRPLPFVPDRDYALIVYRSPADVPIGAEAVQQVAYRHPNGALEMSIDLREPDTQGYLLDRGILDAEDL